jgi:hypothetical protein
MTRQITFEIDDEIAEHFDALVADWKKDPVLLAKAFFEEEVLANTSGSRGVPVLRRYWYRDASVYFTKEELDLREVEREQNRDPIAEAERQKEVDQLFAKIEENRKVRQS